MEWFIFVLCYEGDLLSVVFICFFCVWLGVLCFFVVFFVLGSLRCLAQIFGSDFFPVFGGGFVFFSVMF